MIHYITLLRATGLPRSLNTAALIGVLEFALFAASFC